MNRRWGFLGVIATTLLLGATALAQGPAQFSADMVIHSARGEDLKGKVYFGGDKVRSDMDMRGRSISNITDMGNKKAFTLLNDQKMYMEHDLSKPMNGMARGPRMPDIKQFAENPCANEEGVTCKKTGTETVNGRTCDVWEFTKDNTKDRTVWIDQKLHVPVKMVRPDGTSFELQNIKEGTQPASQFEVPSGYQKMEGMGGMMGRRPGDQ